MILIENFANLPLKKKLLILFILALGLRFASFFTHPYIHSDSVTYLSINHHDVNGDIQTGLDLHRQLPPAILYYMRIFSSLGIDVEVGYRVTTIFLYSLALLSFFYISRFFISEKAALFASFCYACHPKLIEYSHSILRESISIPFMIFGLSLLLMAFYKDRKNIAAVSGIFITISYMARLEYGVAFVLGLFLFLLAVALKMVGDRKDFKKYLSLSSMVFVTMIPLLLIVNIEMKSYESYWDPFAYRKVKGFVLRTFGE